MCVRFFCADFRKLRCYPTFAYFPIQGWEASGRTMFAPTFWCYGLLCRKIAALFADLHLLRDRENGADFVLRYNFCLKHHFCVLFLIKSAPCRLTPIEALPQALLGALPPDPHNGFHPLTLTRGVPLDLLLASLGGSFTLRWLLSLFSFVIPHSSLLT